MSSEKYNYKIFFKNITKLRDEKGWSQNRLAMKCEVSSPYMTQIKNGAYPSTKFLINLFDIFSDENKTLNFHWLFHNEGPQYLYLTKENILKDDLFQNEPEKIMQTVKNIRAIPKDKQDAFLDLVNAILKFNI